MIQAGILLCSAAAIFLLAKGNRWGFVVGLAGQPLWFWSSWRSAQWGILLLSFWYAGCYVKGIRRTFGRANP